MNKISDPYNVVVGIPTINSSQYIEKTLNMLKSEILRLPSKYLVFLIICLNGKKGQKAASYKINRFIQQNSELNIFFIQDDKTGKNNALNRITHFAREHQADIIHFFDDDITLKSGSLLINLETLISRQSNYPVPIMVGSHFVGIRHTFQSFFHTEKKFFKALKCWLLHSIFIVPFLQESDRPRFCIGQSVCGFVADFPDYPDDSTGIADDGFICNYYALKAKKQFYKTSLNPIIKPEESIVYFQIPKSFNEWLKQQVRIYVGVLYSYLYYKEEMSFFKIFFSWEHSVSKEFRRKGKHVNLKHIILIKIHRIFQKIMYFKAMSVIRKKKAPDWNTAYTTKNLACTESLNVN